MARKKEDAGHEESDSLVERKPARRRRKESPLERKEWGYDPLLGLESIKTTMSGLLADLFTKKAGAGSDLPYEPPIDLFEEGDTLIMEMALPGATRHDIQMHAYQNLLIISGELKAPRDLPAERYHFHERQWGAFHRSIPLPFVISPENIRASLRDGILQVTLPVEGKRPSKSVQVKID